MWPGKAGRKRRRDILGDVQAHFVDEPQRAHRHPEIEHRGIDLLDGRALREQLRRLDHVRQQDAIDEEPGAVPDEHGHLADLLHETHRGGGGFRRWFFRR